MTKIKLVRCSFYQQRFDNEMEINISVQLLKMGVGIRDNNSLHHAKRQDIDLPMDEIKAI